MRVARPVRDLVKTESMYRRGLALEVVGRFENHDGFDGIMLAPPGADYHFEFTSCRNQPVTPTPTPEDLTVFYIPDDMIWRNTCSAMQAAGFKRVTSMNPYWDARGQTYEDADGYRIVLQNAQWNATETA